ncbi:hypothetical protein AKO1_014710 [Acrasis kona]|uniref:DUF4209 domain-containing protein n=1 Tax=Acrasis kona TaxID=1008807 RepID=A0AAW2Z218_9EUKA
MGSPVMLNLRNIMWHGFVDEIELHHRYVSFIFLLYLSLCEKLSNKVLVPRPQFSTRGKYIDLVDRWNDYNHSSTFLQDCKDIVMNSYFVVPYRSDIVVRGLEQLDLAINSSDGHDKEFKLLYSIVLLFPQFEHALRQAYVAVNPDQVEEDEIYAASNEFYTTFDSIFRNHIRTTSNKNKLGASMGHSLSDAVMDCFMHYAGPRLRDKCAHGSILDLEPKLALHYHMLFLSLCLHYSKNKIFNSVSEQCYNKISTSTISIYDYRALFIQEWNNYVDCFDSSEFISNLKSTGNTRLQISEVTDFESSFDLISSSFNHSKKNNKIVFLTLCDELVKLQSLLSEKGRKSLVISSEHLFEYLQMYDRRKLEKIELKYLNHYDVLEQHLNLVNICRRMLTLLSESVQVVKDKVSSLENMMDERTARTVHRKTYGLLVQCIKPYFEVIRILSLSVLEQYQDMNREDFIDAEVFYKKKIQHVQKLLTSVERINEASKSGAIGLCLSTLFRSFIVVHKKK